MKTLQLYLLASLIVFSNSLYAAADDHGAHDHDGGHEKTEEQAEHKEHEDSGAHKEHGGHEEHEEEAAEGPHGGRLLTQGDFSIEITIFETGIAPEFRLYVYENNKPIKPVDVRVTILLERLGGEKNTIEFTAEQDYLVSKSEIQEPHSFAVTVDANYQGKPHKWHYESPEGRTTINARAATAAGISAEKVGPATIRQTLDLLGRIALPSDAQYRVAAPYAGIIKYIHVVEGDAVKAGQKIAVVQNVDTLQEYAIAAPADATVTQRLLNVGDKADGAPLLVLADLSKRMVELSVFPADVSQIAVGQNAIVMEGEIPHAATVARIMPSSDNNVKKVWLRLNNAPDAWYPGMAVNAQIIVAEVPAAMAVRAEAIQDFRDMPVVFAQYGDQYEVRMLEIGKRDSEWVEVLGGIEAGTRYVVKNSYLVKADVLKSGASHDH